MAGLDTTLKPCPFCGGAAYFRTPWKERGTAFAGIQVECKRCGIQSVPLLCYEGESLEEMQAAAAERWNRRAQEQPKGEQNGQNKTD